MRHGTVVGAELEVVRPQDRAHDAEERAQDPVLVEAHDGVDLLLDVPDDGVDRAAIVTVGVEPEREQRDEQLGDVRLPEQRPFHVGVRECDPRLTEVLRDGADDDDLAARETGAEHKPVEAVVLVVAAPYAEERLLEDVADPVDVLGDALEPEVVEIHGRASGGRDLVRPLVDDLRAHVLERRQHVGERYPLGAEQLAADESLRCLERPIEAHDRLGRGAQLLDPADVRDRRAGDPLVAVGRRERTLVGAEHLARLILAVLLDQRGAEVVVPRPGRLDEPRLELGEVDVLRRAVGTVDDVVHAREHRLGELEEPVDVRAAERVGEDPGDALTVLGVEPIPRDADEALDEAIEPIPTHEQAQPLALAEGEDPDRDVEQIVALNLEHGVPRVGLEDLDERLVVMAVRREPGALEHVVDLAAHDRNLARARFVRNARVQAEESALTDDRAVRVELLDADVIEVRGAVHRGPRVRLRDHERVRRAGELDGAGAELRVRRHRRAAKDPEPRVEHGLQSVLLTVGDGLVLAVPEEREVIVSQPLQERLGLLDAGGIESRRLLLVKLSDERLGPPAHRVPIGDRGMDLAQDTLDARGRADPGAPDLTRVPPRRGARTRGSRPPPRPPVPPRRGGCPRRRGARG